MGSASRTALAAAQASLNEFAGEASIGTSLLEVAGRLQETPALAAAFADPVASISVKTTLADRLFSGLSSSARSVLIAALTQTWSNAEELIDGVEELALRAEAVASPQFADELLSMARTIESDHSLELNLGSKLGDPNLKATLATRLFAAKISAGAVRVLRHFITHPRGRRVNVALRESARHAADQSNRELATVTVATAPSPAQQQRIQQILERQAGRPVWITTVIDPTLLGGMRVQIGDEIIDGSVRSRIQELRQQLAS